MAYFAGNAFHISYKMKMINGDSDSRQTCGSGVLIYDNFFYGNIGLKRHNGGAFVIRCEHYTSDEEEAEAGYINSGRYRDEVYQDVSTYLQDDLIPILENPSEIYFELEDPISDETYSMLKYGTLIEDNTFANNYSGMKGTAFLIERINEIQIRKNQFTDNGPVTASKEIQFSPYYKFMTDRQRTVSFYMPSRNFIDEAQYFDRGWDDGYTIDMPMVQGAIFIKNCFDLETCFGIQSDFDNL